MAEFSDYYEDKIIDHMLRGQAFTPPATVYLALFTAVTGLEADNPTAEVSGGSYARQAITLTAASGGATTNSGAITFPTATAAWGVVTHGAIVDHLSNVTWGTDVHVLLHSPLDASKDVGIGDTFKVSDGELDLTVA